MSVSTTITFLKNRHYHEWMLKAVNALIRVKVKKLPPELEDYFGTDDPDKALQDTDKLLDVECISIDDPTGLPAYARSVDSDYSCVIEIDLDKLPSNVKHIRVSQS